MQLAMSMQLHVARNTNPGMTTQLGRHDEGCYHLLVLLLVFTSRQLHDQLIHHAPPPRRVILPPLVPSSGWLRDDDGWTGLPVRRLYAHGAAASGNHVCRWQRDCCGHGIQVEPYALQIKTFRL
jgi:hypothetical protein